MKIVVTDGATLNPGDLSWDRLKSMGDCVVYERSTYAENLLRCKDTDIAVTNKVLFDKKTIDTLPKLKCISVTATGYNIIDINAAKERKIVVMNVPIYGTMSVAQMTFALLLELTQHVGDHSRTVHEGKWVRSTNFCYWDYPLIELAGLTMGVVGCGRIGLAVAKLAKAFDMKVIAYDVITPKLEDKEIRFVELDTLIRQSDVISLHCPLTPQTDKFINKDFISKMKKTAFILNASRGQLVNEQELADALDSGRIAGAGLDVVAVEPPKAENPLLTAKNCVITPHIAWATHSARKRLLNTSIDNVQAFIEGKPQNVVS